MRKFKTYIVVVLVIIGMGFLSSGLYIKSKAFIAQFLIERAWHKTVETKKYNEPWPWADTKIVLRMYIPKIDKDIYILESHSAQALAFGPGHSSVSFLPGQNGTILLSAHRDTHFSFLKDMKINDEIRLFDSKNKRYRYKINYTKVIDSKKEKIGIYTGKEELVLVTCWPFDNIVAGGNERYVVYAKRV